MNDLTVIEALAQVSDGDGRVSGRRAVDKEEGDSSTTLYVRKEGQGWASARVPCILSEQQKWELK
jgi:hypothetical protein